MNELEKLQEKILTDVSSLPIIDSHDHIGPDANGIIPEFDLCDLIFYNLNPDLINAGMPGIGTHAQTPWPPESKDSGVKWHAINKYLNNIENLTSYKVLLNGIKELYDFPYQTINDSNWKVLNEQVESAYKNKDWTDFVLKDKCKIIAVIVDMDTIQMDRNYFFPAIKLDYIMMGGLNPLSREKIETKHNTKIQKIEDLVELIHTVFENYTEAGAVAIKSVAAYYRSIKYNLVSFKEAKAIFDTDYKKINREMEKNFQNFVMHEIMKLVNEKEMPIQFHTGKLAWNFQTITNTNPVHLTNLLQKYRSAKFDLFHGGLPYANEFGILANNFPNVYLDLNGLMWTSLLITKKYLSEWIEMVPQNKIVWGADSFRVLEGVVGQVNYFKKILSDVLAEKIIQGYFDEEFALEFARKILYKNAHNLFDIAQT
jgi:predicted TIM-barrel fold metal-dependent hydrolase